MTPILFPYNNVLTVKQQLNLLNPTVKSTYFMGYEKFKIHFSNPNVDQHHHYDLFSPFQLHLTLTFINVVIIYKLAHS